MNVQELKKTANQVRKNIVTAVYYAKAGHPGGSLSAADIYTYLYMEEMNIDPAEPAAPDRDRFVLSKGHTCPGLYGVMVERGYFEREELKTFRHIGTRLQGHPSMHYLPGIDMSSGSLGQGISCAVGIALAAKLQDKEYDIRSTMDLDTTLRGLPLTEEKVLEAVGNIIRIDLEDEVTFETVSINTIRKDDNYGGFCVRINAIFDTMLIPLSINVKTQGARIYSGLSFFRFP